MNETVEYEYLARENEHQRRTIIIQRAALAVAGLALACVVSFAGLLNREVRSACRERDTAERKCDSLRAELACERGVSAELGERLRRAVTVTNIVTRIDFGPRDRNGRAAAR